ncbi:MAG TPA: tetratricopeptide repeat protein [Verrucomicrobiae bacterium]|nr:tetratricopeptide repeat protein [Verrucomicrobiae bacterium]
MSPQRQAPEEKIGPYILRRKLGEGAIGVVWLAVDPKLRRQVAVKLLQPEYSRDERMVGRFLREAQSAAKLNHPNTVAIYQAGESGGAVFIVMEWVDGGNLQDYLGAHGRMAWPEATRVIRDAAAGLSAAHEVGLIHRDIKPSNLMRTTRGVIKVVDFGLARPFDQRSDITRPGAVIGTPAYMSPEQCAGGDLDARSDLYSLVCTYYHLLGGEPPFGSGNIGDVLYKQRHAPLPDVRLLVPDLPEAIGQILSRGTQKAPTDRFASASELIAQLGAALGLPHAPAAAMSPDPEEAATILSEQETVLSPNAAPLIPEPTPLPPSNLPVQLTSFVGRRREMIEIKQLLDKTRLLTLVGTGGSGKTRLALEVAGELLESYKHGVSLVEFAALSDPALVPDRVVAALGLREEPGRPLTETLVNTLRTKCVLLVLDNCEHLRSACAQLAETLLRGCPNIRILVSSRESLRVAGETIYNVASLGLPSAPRTASTEADLATALVQFEELRNSEAVQLFAERAASNQPRFALTDGNVREIAHICRRLDGIPLAIELAAARVKMLSVQQIASRLDDSIQLLTRGVETALPRQQTLRATMDWSYDLLEEKERVLFGRLAVFAGGFALETCESVCVGDGLQGGEILDLLSELVDKSLASVIEVDEDQQIRYRLLETIRQYAREKLESTSDSEGVRARHREFFLQLAERGGAQLTGPDQASWLQRLEMEHDNLQIALAWAVTRDVTLGIRLAKALGRFWEFRGHWKEGLRWLEQCLSAGDTVAKDLRAAALDAAGNLASCQGDYRRARALFEEQLALQEELADQRGIADALHNLMSVAWKHGNYDEARSLEEKSLAVRRTLGDKSGIASSLHALGTFAHEQGDFPKAVALYEEALAIRRGLGDMAGIATLLNNIGNLAQAQGHNDRVRALQEESLAIRRKIGDKAGISQSLTNLAVLAQEQRDFNHARALLEESLTIDRELGNKKGIAVSLRNYAELMQLQGELPRASVLYQQSLGLFRELDDKVGVTACMEGFAVLATIQNEADRAARLFGIAEGLRVALGAGPSLSFETGEYNARIEAARTQLGGAPFATLWSEGKQMDHERAISYALQTTRSTGGSGGG